MDLRNAWNVARKDLLIFRKRRSVIYSTVLFPLFVAVGLPLIISRSGAAKGVPGSVFGGILDAFAFFFVIGAVTLPTAIASYSLVGEKVQKSMEPLLATPVSDSEILLGKMVSAVLPPLGAIYAGSILFMALMDRVTYQTLGYNYFPNATIAVILLVVVPLSSLMSVEFNVILSSRMNDARAVQQLGGIIVLPFAGIYVLSEVGYITLDPAGLLMVAGVLLLIDAALLYVSKALFRREEILTKWK